MRRSVTLSLVVIALLTSALSLTLFSQAPSSSPRQTPRDGTFRIGVDVNLVEVHVSALDKTGNAVEGLTQENFQILEDNKVQDITLFKHEDVPLSIGMVIDNSGSMRDKRAKVETAALTLVKDSNKDDEVFDVNFNDEAFLDNPHGKDFTNNLKELEEALTRIDSRGGTAMRDAMTRRNAFRRTCVSC